MKNEVNIMAYISNCQSNI